MLFEYAVRKLFDEILAQFKMGLRDFRKFIFGLFVSAAPFLAGFGFGVWLLQDFGAPVRQKRHRQRTFCVEIVLVDAGRASVDDGFLRTGQ